MPLGFTRLNERKQRPNPNINFIKPIEGPHKDVSHDFLSRIAAVASPIMKTATISVMSLEEFPPNREFWGRNFNAGEVIQLVLRSPSTGKWLPFHFVAMVFMHELAHCKEMNHSRAFWKVRNVYSAELKELWDRGYVGNGLFGKGHSLYDGQIAQDALPPTDAESVAGLCGGAYRGFRGKRKRKANAGKPQLTYAERKQRRIAKKFGTNGLALGDNEEARLKLENGKKVKGKPRVAGSNRGRELRAAALLDRIEQAKAPPLKPEPEDSDTESESDYEEPPIGQREAVDGLGQPILDLDGHRLVQVCEGEDQSHDPDAQKEMDELFSGRQSEKSHASSVANPAIKSEVSDEEVPKRRSKSASEKGQERSKQSQHCQTASSQNTSSVKSEQTLSAGFNCANGRSSMVTEQNASEDAANSCPVCSLANECGALMCAVCGNVLAPEKITTWRCSEPACKQSGYNNASDAGICGICGTSKEALRRDE